MRLALMGGFALDRPYASYAWALLAYGHALIFGLPLMLTLLAISTQSPAAASNALTYWYLCYEVGYRWVVFGVSALFFLMMASSWEFYVSADSMEVAQVGYDLFDMAKSDLIFYWASQAMFASFVNKRTLHYLRVGLIEVANGIDTEEENSEADTAIDVDINDDDGSSITF